MFPQSEPPIEWRQLALLSHDADVAHMSWVASGEGLLVCGQSEVAMWHRSKEDPSAFFRLWETSPAVSQGLAAASSSPEGPCATADSSAIEIGPLYQGKPLAFATVYSFNSLVAEEGKEGEGKRGGSMEEEGNEGENEGKKRGKMGTISTLKLPHPEQVVDLKWRPGKSDLVLSVKYPYGVRRARKRFLLTCCVDGVVRLWMETVQHGTDGTKEGVSFLLGAVVEPGVHLGGKLGGNLRVFWGEERGMRGTWGPQQGEKESADVAACDWLVGVGADGTVVLWAVGSLDDGTPVRCPRVVTWQKADEVASSHWLEDSHTVDCLMEISHKWGPPRALEIVQASPGGTLLLARLWPPLTALSGGKFGGTEKDNRGPSKISKNGGTWGKVFGSFRMGGLSSGLLDFAVLSGADYIVQSGTESDLGEDLLASLAEDGQILIWRKNFLPSCPDISGRGGENFAGWTVAVEKRTVQFQLESTLLTSANLSMTSLIEGGKTLNPEGNSGENLGFKPQKLSWLPWRLPDGARALAIVFGGKIEFYVVGCQPGAELALRKVAELAPEGGESAPGFLGLYFSSTGKYGGDLSLGGNLWVVCGDGTIEIWKVQLKVSPVLYISGEENLGDTGNVPGEPEWNFSRFPARINFSGQDEKISCVGGLPVSSTEIVPHSNDCPFDFATGHKDGTVRFWKISEDSGSGKLEKVGVLRAHFSPVKGVQVAPGGTFLSTCGDHTGPGIPGELKIWSSQESLLEPFEFGPKFEKISETETEKTKSFARNGFRLEGKFPQWGCQLAVSHWLRTGQGRVLLAHAVGPTIKFFSPGRNCGQEEKKVESGERKGQNLESQSNWSQRISKDSKSTKSTGGSESSPTVPSTWCQLATLTCDSTMGEVQSLKWDPSGTLVLGSGCQLAFTSHWTSATSASGDHLGLLEASERASSGRPSYHPDVLFRYILQGTILYFLFTIVLNLPPVSLTFPSIFPERFPQFPPIPPNFPLKCPLNSPYFLEFPNFFIFSFPPIFPLLQISQLFPMFPNLPPNFHQFPPILPQINPKPPTPSSASCHPYWMPPQQIHASWHHLQHSPRP